MAAKDKQTQSVLEEMAPSKSIIKLAIPATLALLAKVVYNLLSSPLIRQSLFYVPFILTLPKLLGITGIYFSQPAADILTILVCLLSIKSMKRIASRNMGAVQE